MTIPSDLLFFIVEIIGTIAFAISGAMTAIERRLDLFGVLFLGATTAIGGGIFRDRRQIFLLPGTARGRSAEPEQGPVRRLERPGRRQAGVPAGQPLRHRSGDPQIF